MAYDPKSLSALSYANGFTLWHYRTGDDATDVDDVGYFNNAGPMLRVGDLVFVNAGVGVVPSTGVMVVVSNANGVVDTSNLTSFGLLNND